LADTIKRYVIVYNQYILQKSLGHIPPLQAQQTTPLFCTLRGGATEVPNQIGDMLKRRTKLVIMSVSSHLSALG